MLTNKQIAERCRETRSWARLKPKRVAQEMGVSLASIYRWENGDTTVPAFYPVYLAIRGETSLDKILTPQIISKEK